MIVQSQLKKRNSVIKSGFWYTISNFLTRSIVFITTPIFARILTVEEFGKFHVYANWQSILMIICSMELVLTVNRARIDLKDDELNNYLGNCVFINMIATLIIFCLFEVFPWIRQNVLVLDNKYIIFMFIYLMFSPSFELFQTVQRVRYRYVLSTILSFFTVFLGAGMALLGAYISEDKLFGRIVGQYIPVSIVGIVFWGFYISKLKRVDFAYWKYGLHISIPLLFSYIGSQILASSDKIVVQHMSTDKEVAYVGLVTTCSHIVTILIQSLNNAWAPFLYDGLQSGDFRMIKKVFRYYCWFVYLCTFGVVLVGPEMLYILGANKYEEAIVIIPPAISFCIFNMLIFQCINIETYYKKTRFAAYATAIVATMNIILDIYMVKLKGYVAVSYVTIFCYFLLMCFHFAYVHRIDSSNLVTANRIIESTVAVCVIITTSMIAFKTIILRIILIFTLFICGVMMIKGIYKSMVNKKRINKE